MKAVEKQVRFQLDDQVRDQIHYQVSCQIRFQVRDSQIHEVESYHRQVLNQVEHQVWEELRWK